MADRELADRATSLLDLCRDRGLKIATAESCTGGLVAAALTDIAGSSDVLDRGFVTYSNAAKQVMLSVPAATLEQFGAVSRQTAESMAKGVLAHAPVDLAVSITGIAGPGGATDGKPIGLVHFAAATRSGRLVHQECQYGDIGRAQVRRASVIQALAILQALAELEAVKAKRA
ncbi:MAG: CinA family protein [Xanthobacteraceae bacterium]